MFNKKNRILAKLALIGATAIATQLTAIYAEGLEELEPYVMISKFRSVDTEILPITLTSINEETLYENGIGTMSDALEEAPGVFMQTNSGRIKRPSIRGTSNNHSLILLDGRRMVSGFKGLADLGQILSCGVERVDIIRGPASAMYGSDAIGGVVNIITKRAKSETLHGNVRLQANTGKWDGYNATTSGGQKKGNIGIYGSVGYRHTNEWESGDGAPSDMDDIDSYGALANIDYYISNKQKILSGIQYSHTERIGMRPKQGSSRRNATDQRTGVHSTYVHNFSDDTMAQVRVYGEEYSTKIRFDLPTTKFDYDLNTEMWSIDAFINKQFTEYLQVTAGGDISSTKQEEPLESTGKSTQDRSAIFAQALWSPIENLKTMFGARVDHYDEFNEHTSPRIALKYKLKDQIFLSTSFGKGFRAPSIAELKVESCTNGGKITILPNEELSPESSKSFDIGLEYNKGSFSASVTAFHTEVNDMIEAITILPKTQQWMNVSKVEIDGIETQLTTKLSKTLCLKMQLDWLDPVNKSTGLHLENQHRLNGRIILVKKFTDWDIKARIGLHYEGKEWTSDGGTEDEAWVVNAKIEKQINDNWSVYCGSKNLTDTDKTNWPARYYLGVKFKQ